MLSSLGEPETWIEDDRLIPDPHSLGLLQCFLEFTDDLSYGVIAIGSEIVARHLLDRPPRVHEDSAGASLSDVGAEVGVEEEATHVSGRNGSRIRIWPCCYL